MNIYREMPLIRRNCIRQKDLGSTGNLKRQMEARLGCHKRINNLKQMRVKILQSCIPRISMPCYRTLIIKDTRKHSTKCSKCMGILAKDQLIPHCNRGIDKFKGIIIINNTVQPVIKEV